jgi:ubiquinone/menaquinone biosynthesis C-methylase UbiE
MVPNSKYNIWEHSAIVRQLYADRCRDTVDEMTCARQCAEILQPLLKRDSTVLDAGCGSGYYWHALRRRDIECQYYGIDYSPTLIDIGQRYLPSFGLPVSRLRAAMIEDLDTRYEAVVCFNVLPLLPHYHQALERLCAASDRYLLIRTALDDRESIRYEEDGYLEEGYNHLKSYWNIYAQAEFEQYIQDQGFRVRRIRDLRTDDGVEMVVGKPFPWRILLGERIGYRNVKT